jgi:hypothetical protein
MLEDIRTYARLQLATGLMMRHEYLAAVLAYAVEKHGDGQDVKMHADRTARYFWDKRG